MSIDEQSVKLYLESLDNLDKLDLKNPQITTVVGTSNIRSQFGQSLIAFRYAKKVIFELKHHTSSNERKLLSQIYEALLQLPDIAPSDLHNLFKLPGILLSLKNIGDFNKKQLDVLSYGKQWIEMEQCSAKSEKIIKKSVYALAFLLKTIEFDLLKDLGKPLIKAGKILLLTADQRHDHLLKVQELIQILNKKSLVPLQVLDYKKEFISLDFQLKRFNYIDSSKKIILKRQLEQLIQALNKHIFKTELDKNRFLKEDAPFIKELDYYKKLLRNKGEKAFWHSFNT
jgi:hypothetical protein